VNKPPVETPPAPPAPEQEPDFTPKDPLGIHYREREKSITLQSLTEQVEQQREAKRKERPEGWSVTSQAETAIEPETELLTMNIGPHHPATHGVLRLLTTLEGEVVKSATPLIGYVHTGIEKNCEDKSYWKVIPLIERMDYVSYYFNALGYCMSVEKLLDEEVPERAQWLRVIHLEMCRIHSHLVWLGTSALDLGAISMFWYCFRERDNILDLFEMSSGQRMHTRYFQIGGVADDIPTGFADKLTEWVTQMPGRIDQFADLLDKNEIFLQRMQDVGAVSEERLLELGVTGPLLRATGNPWDLRKAAPYTGYENFDFKIPVGTKGDNYDRYKVRLMEMYESCKIIEQALAGLPEGPWITDNRKVALPPRHELATSMEALIHHFKLVTEGIRVPEGEVYVPIESPRGELGCFVRSDGSSKPARVHMREPSFVNLQGLSDMVNDTYLADMIATLAMLDPILGGIDR
jgi:NADH-quinone oxidoreductase subunit D